MADNKLTKLEFYCMRDIPIFPLAWMVNGRCSCADEKCPSPGKHPLVSGGFYAASIEIEQVKAWHEKFPLANWGMRTGDKEKGGSGIAVVDIDPRNNGDTTWEILREENPGPIETVTVATSGGGQHLWFQHPPSASIASGSDMLGPGCGCESEWRLCSDTAQRNKPAIPLRIEPG